MVFHAGAGHRVLLRRLRRRGDVEPRRWRHHGDRSVPAGRRRDGTATTAMVLLPLDRR